MPNQFGTFTERARGVLARAQEEARRRRHRHIGTEHLLLGIADVREGVVPMALMNLAVDPRAVKAVTEQVATPDPEPQRVEPKLSGEARESLELAVTEARRMEQPRIDAEQILLGLAENEGSVAARILRHLGAEPGALRSEIERLVAARGAE